MTFPRPTWMWGLLVLAVLCAGCADDGGDSGDITPDNTPNNDVADTAVATLSPVDHLTRASIALRGQRPSLQELQRVAEDPDALPEIVDGYLEEASFGETIRDLHNEAWQLRSFFHSFPPFGSLRDVEVTELNRSVQEAPLKLIEHVVMNDLPYSDIVTADYTLANGLVAEVWGMDYDGDGFEWTQTRWPEPGRPHAGILSDSFLFIRHDTTLNNFNRGRANTVSKALLCFDFLTRDITVDGQVDLSDPVAVNSALRSNEACAGCHQALDPLGVLLFSYELRINTFQLPNNLENYPLSTYRPQYASEVRRRFPEYRAAYFGDLEPDNQQWGVKELGEKIADDPRFSMCASQRFYSYMAQVPLNEVPFEVAADLQKTFIESGLNAKALAKAVVLSEAFKQSHAQDDQTDAEHLIGVLRTRPSQMARQIEALTGFRWTTQLDVPLIGETYGHTDLMTDALVGYSVLAGETDSFQVPNPSHAPNTTTALVQATLAAEAAGFVVLEDFGADSEPKRLLTEIDPAQDTDEDSVREQLAVLHAKLFSEMVEPDSETVTRTYQLFEAALEISNDPGRAWATVLTAMFQDTRFTFH